MSRVVHGAARAAAAGACCVFLFVPSAFAGDATAPTAAAEPTGQVTVTGATGAPRQAGTLAKKTKKKKPSGRGGGSPRIDIAVTGTYRQHSKGYVLKGALVKVKGSVDGDFDGLKVVVTVKRGKKTVLTDKVTLKTSGAKSVFSLNYRIRRAGYYRFRAAASGDDPSNPLDARSEYVSVVTSNIKRGSHGIAVRVIQSKLARLHYVVSGDGTFDDALGRALLAFRKVNRMSRVESAGRAVGRKLARNSGTFRGKYPKAGRHVEVDLSRQVMALYEGKRLARIYHVSTGAGATPTIRGRFHVYMKTPGTNAKGMVHSSYFIRGYAIHGFASVPTYPASHGCVRVPIPNAQSIYDWLHIGERIDVYY